MQTFTLILSSTQAQVIEMLLIEKALKEESTISKSIAREMIFKFQSAKAERPPWEQELDAQFVYDLR